jgi:hypothetical protein
MKVSKAIARAGLAAALAATLCVGCGPSTAGPRSQEEASIRQIWQVYHSYQKGNKPPPKGPGDLMALQRAFPGVIESVKSRDILVYWGVGFEDGSEGASTVLAYRKEVPEKGGEVLMRDGTARTMTAEEFGAARKPPGATTEFQLPTPGKSKKKR